MTGAPSRPEPPGTHTTDERGARATARRVPALLLAPSLLLMVAVFVGSLVTLVGYSFQERRVGFSADGMTLATWTRFLTDPFQWSVVWTSLRVGLVVTVVSIVIGYPVAYAVSRIRRRDLVVAACVVLFSPLLVSIIVRSYAWMLILSEQGFVNSVLGALPGSPGPFRLLYNEVGVVIALVHVLLPFAVLPVLSLLLQIPQEVREAAFDLGASPARVFLRVTLPLSLSGVISAAQIMLALSLSAFVTPALLGGGRVRVLSNSVYDNIVNLDWAMASVQALVLLLLTLAIIGALGRLNRASYGGRGV